jgi:putative ABC transport system permease protein
MNIEELSHLFKAAILDFKRNKVRTFLTSLGIMIGVLSVVMLIALGIGLKNYIANQFESLGAKLVIIFPGNVFSEEGGLGGNFGAGFAGGVRFDEKDVNTLKKISEVDYVVPVYIKSSIVEAKSTKKLSSVMGSSEDIFEVLNLVIEKGEKFDKADVARKAKVAVLGSSIAEDLFNEPGLAIGEIVRFSNQRFEVIGVAQKKGDRDIDSAVIVPYSATFGSINPDKKFFTIYLGIKDDQVVGIAKEKARDILLKRYEKDEFSVTEQSQILSTVNQIFNILNGVLVAIGSISLLVGGVGIMNIMYATVTERTKEVGIRRAVGATKKDILLQFLTESVVLSVFGGLSGLLFAIVLVILIRPFFPVAINALAVMITLGISSAIGIFFGVFPARRAANLPPIEAIRYE